DCEDLLMRITVFNRGPEPAQLHVLPTAWFRNTWCWTGDTRKPALCARVPIADCAVVEAQTLRYAQRWLYFEGRPELLFTENETNTRRLFGFDNGIAFTKDGINDYLVNGVRDAVNGKQVGTKAAAHYLLELPERGSAALRVRLSPLGPDRLSGPLDR